MLTTSADYKTAIAATDREMRGYLKFNNDSTKIMRGYDGLISIKHTAQIADQERPTFACACASLCEVDFYNSGLPAGVSLANSYFDAYIGVVTKDTGTAPLGSIEPDTKTVEYVFMGRFFIDTVDRGKLSTKVTAYDDNGKLNKPYVCNVAETPSGYPINQIVGDIRVQCGLISQTTPSVNMGYVPKIYECTCRQMLGWVISVYSSGANCFSSRAVLGQIEYITVWGAYNHKDDAGHTITDNTIYLGGLSDNPAFSFNSVVTGTEDNPVSVGSGTGIVGENPYYDAAKANTLLTNISGITYTPTEIEFRGDPAIEQGDVMKVVSGGNTFYTYVQKVVTTFNGGCKQTLYCYGDSEWHYDMSTSPTEAKIKTAVSNMAQEIQQEIETADNGVITKILDLDGSWKELVIANNQDLSAATSVWRWNINGLAHSTAYSGGTYNFAVDMNGRIIANMIQTGILTDANGYNSWNLDTGAFTITNGSINITTSNSSYDQIVLRYGEYKTTYSASTVSSVRTVGGSQRSRNSLASDYFYMFDSNNKFCVTLYNGTSESQQVPGQGTGYLKLYNNKVDYGYKPSISLCNFEDGHLTDLGSYHLNMTSDSIAIYVGQGNGTSRGVMSLSASSNSQQFTFTDNATAIQTVRLDSSMVNHSGRLKLTNGTREYLLDTSGLSDQTGLIMYHDTSKLTAKIEPDGNGAGRLFLGDGTGTVNIVSLTNAGLTFRDSSNTVTATYPATGLPMLNGAADNTTQSGAVIAVPYVTHSTLGISSSATDFEVSKAWAKYVAAQYPNKEYCVFIGTVAAGTVRNAQMMAYKTNNTNADGIPQYCNVQLSRYTGGIFYYTCDNGTYKRVAFLDQSSLRFLDSNGYSTATYPATDTQITRTHTTNSYCSSTSTGRVWIRKQGSFGILHFNLSIDSTALTSSAGFVEIMKFSGITLKQDEYCTIPSQSGNSTILMQISTAGIVKIYTDYGSASGFYRAEMPLIFAS